MLTTELKLLHTDELFEQGQDLHFKVVVLGGSSVGKSNILNQLVYKRFLLGTEPTIGIQFGVLNLTLQQRFFKMDLWDMEYQRDFASIPKGFLANAIGNFGLNEGALVVIDLTRRESIQEAKKLIRELEDHSNNYLAMALLANKKDLVNLRDVSAEDVADLQECTGLKYFEVSAYSGEGLSHAIEVLLKDITKMVSGNHSSGGWSDRGYPV